MKQGISNTLLNSYIFFPPRPLKQMYQVLPVANNSSQSWLSTRKIWGAFKNPHTLAISQTNEIRISGAAAGRGAGGETAGRNWTSVLF